MRSGIDADARAPEHPHVPGVFLVARRAQPDVAIGLAHAGNAVGETVTHGGHRREERRLEGARDVCVAGEGRGGGRWRSWLVVGPFAGDIEDDLVDDALDGCVVVGKYLGHLGYLTNIAALRRLLRQRSGPANHLPGVRVTAANVSIDVGERVAMTMLFS